LPSRAPGPSLPERIRSLPLDTLTREALAELAERAEHAAEFERMLTRARAGLPAVLPVAPPRRHRRDRHGLHIVPGVVVAAVMWAVRSRAPKLAAAAVALALGGTVLAPELPAGVASAGRPPAAMAPAIRHHGTRPVPTRSAAAVLRRRSSDDDDPLDADSAEPAPTDAPSPTPSPSPGRGHHRHPPHPTPTMAAHVIVA
jgi:hypothetical protein